MAERESFRIEIKEWLKANCPPSMRTAMPEEEQVWGGRKAEWVNPDSKIWMEKAAERGFTVPLWPKEYGGGGLSKEEAKILNQEMFRIHARPPLLSFGIWMLGPVLLEFGNEAQKKEHLPKIAQGAIRWCQGYSEPGAGSDLAGLQTKAEDKGDHYLVNGQKIWTSYADKADWIFCLVRTDKTKKHEGISFLLIDMATKGVETKPIRLISGASPFCETFFTDVKVPKENLVHELNQGWVVAKRLLQYERQAISNFGGAMFGGGGALEDLAKDYCGEEEGRVADGGLREHVARHKMGSHAFMLTIRRTQEEAKAGGPSAATSILKYFGAEHNKDRYELLLDIMGMEGLGWEGAPFSEEQLDTTRGWLRSKGNSIEGGTSEIQLNVIAKRVLGLPD